MRQEIQRGNEGREVERKREEGGLTVLPNSPLPSILSEPVIV